MECEGPGGCLEEGLGHEPMTQQQLNDLPPQQGYFWTSCEPNIPGRCGEIDCDNRCYVYNNKRWELNPCGSRQWPNDMIPCCEYDNIPPIPRSKIKSEIIIEDNTSPLGHNWTDPRNQTPNSIVIPNPSLPFGHPGSCEPHTQGPPHQLPMPLAREYYAGVYKITPFSGVEPNGTVEWEERLNPGWIRFIWDDNTPEKEANYGNIRFIEISTIESNEEVQLDYDDLLIHYPNTSEGGCKRNFSGEDGRSFYENLALLGGGYLTIYPVNPRRSGSEWVRIRYDSVNICLGCPWIQLHKISIDTGSENWREALVKLKPSATCPSPNNNKSCMKSDMSFLSEPYYYYAFFDYAWDLWVGKRRTGSSEIVEGPFGIEGFYPLYRAKASANGASPNASGSHEMKINNVIYYMPNGLTSGKTLFHGDYTGGVYSFGPFSIDDHYPLYRTEDDANIGSPNNSGSYPRIIKGITYYIPNGWKE